MTRRLHGVVAGLLWRATTHHPDLADSWTTLFPPHDQPWRNSS